MWAQMIARVPEPADNARRGAARPARSLLCGVRGNPLRFEAVDGARRIVSRDLMQSGIDDGCYARNGQGGLGDVGRHDDAPAVRGPERSVLIA